MIFFNQIIAFSLLLLTKNSAPDQVKFRYSEKATKFGSSSTLFFTLISSVKSKWKIGQIFMTLSEYLSFKKSQLKQLPDGRYYKPGRSCGILNSIKLLQKMPEKVDEIEGA